MILKSQNIEGIGRVASVLIGSVELALCQSSIISLAMSGEPNCMLLLEESDRETFKTKLCITRAIEGERENS